MNRHAIPALFALSLAGCSSGGFAFGQGGMNDATNSFASDHNFSFSCSKFDPTSGVMTDQVTIVRNINPNVQAVAAMGTAFQAVVGLVGAIAKPVPGPVPGALAAPRGVPPGYSLDVPTCLGEHGVNTPMPNPPNPQPPQQGSQQGSQQQSGRETGQNPRPYAPAAYAPPSLDANGVAHATDDRTETPR